jgi:tungstate transport system substrate-binding protein
MRRLSSLLAALLGTVVAASTAADESPTEALVLATTTSVRDSGLFEELLPLFEAQSGIRVRLVAVGSGAALRMGAEGNADVLVTHAADAEEALAEEGAIVDRRPFMQNHFVIAGPREDPADVVNAPSAADAVQRIAAAGAPFVSRGDESGTHMREVALFREAGFEPEARWDGFVRTGAGMGLSLQVAGERRAYVLSDLGTFRAFQDRIDLVPLSRREPALRNVYSVIRPNPARFRPGTLHVAGAKRFAEFLLSPEVSARIRAFGREPRGEPLFVPLSPQPADEDADR